MARRVIIQGNSSGSPFRVSVAGVDAAGAQFNNLIFDGNQPPLQLWSTGAVSVPVLGFSDPHSANFSDGPHVPVTPSGTTPIFLTVVRQPVTSGVVNSGGLDGSYLPGFRTYNFFGMGGAIVDDDGNMFVGFSSNRDIIAGGAFSGSGVVNYAIMQNYQ